MVERERAARGVQVRIVGAPEDVAEAAEAIGEVLEVERESRPRPSRKHEGEVLVYMDARCGR